MSVQMQQFRVVGVRNATGEDVSIIIDAATKAAAEVKAEQMDIETTHIVRIKEEQPTPPDEHELFSAEAAQALAGKRTINLIEEVITQEESRTPPPAEPEPIVPAINPQARHDDIVTAITRPIYAAPSTRRESSPDSISGARAFSFVLLVLLGITAGAYFVLVHEPNKINADDHELIFGQDLFSDVIDTNPVSTTNAPMRDAFGSKTAKPTNTLPINKDQQVFIGNPDATTPGEAASAAGQTSKTPTPRETLELQSVVTSHEGRFAVINGKLYKQGTTVAGCKLVNVADDWVLMEKDGRQFTLQIEANDTP